MGKIAKCKHCGAELPSKANACPRCGKNCKKPPVGLIVCVLLVAIVAVIAAVASSGSSESGGITQQPEVNQTGPASGEVKKDLIFEKDGLKIYFTGFEAPQFGAKGYYINIRIENGSDKNYTIQADEVSLGDTMLKFGDWIFSPEVLAGKSMNDHIWVINLDERGVEMPLKTAQMRFVTFVDGINAETREVSDMITFGK